ncbi:MAG TPA: hypothetical protein VG842_08045 [Sediminibacterium sp.]|nr:hypothetical protein [Sediminibacterium sp.]
MYQSPSNIRVNRPQSEDSQGHRAAGRPAVPVQKQAVVPTSGSQVVAQLASDYSGLLPGHDTFQQSYTFDGKKKTDFTYHHIIPENKLVTVVGKLKEILRLAAGDTELEKKQQKLESNAEEQWQKTRAQDTAFAVNGLFPKETISVTSEELLPHIKTNTTLDTLWVAIREEVLKPKILALRDRLIQKMRRPIVDLLNDPENARIIRIGYMPSVRSIVEQTGMGALTRIDPYAPEMIGVADIADALVAVSNNEKKIEAVIQKAQSLNPIDTYITNALPYVSSSANSGETLKAKVKENGIPNSDHSEDKLKYAVQWNPGNIHRGPKSDMRISGGEGYNELVDDGGEKFEKAAVNLVSTEHFGLLVELNKKVDLLAAANITTPLDPMILTLAKQTMDTMISIQGMGLTGFKASNWSEQDVGGKKIARLNQQDEKIGAARHAGHL